MSHTPTTRTIRDEVLEHAEVGAVSTKDSAAFLGLPAQMSSYMACNLYSAALSIIRQQKKENDRLTAEVARLREALKTAIDWIRNAPEDTWGEGSNSEGMRWPIRDELVDKLCKSLNPEEPK